MILKYVDVSDGTVLDTITLDGRGLRFDTGEAREVVEALRLRTPGGSDEDVFQALVDGGWSNGYAAIKAGTTP